MTSNPSNMESSVFITYLAEHGINEVKQCGDEISFPCPFSGCDDDRRGNEEFHCGFNLTNCTYNCFKCGATGNYITLRKHFGDYEEYNASQKAGTTYTEDKGMSPLEKRVKKIHDSTREQVREYLNGRGINNESIDIFMLGIGSIGKKYGYIIPIFDRNGKIPYVKIRRTIEAESTETIAKAMGQKAHVPKYSVYPAGTSLILVGEDQLAKSTSSDVLICEGELDRIIAIQEGVKIPVVTSGGAQTFKDEWIKQLENMRNIYICMDTDKTGENATEKLTQKLTKQIPAASIYRISLPFEPDTHSDLTDYFTKKCGTADELFSKYAEFYCGAKPIDPMKFKEMDIDAIAKVLDITIKHDCISKVITFLVMLLTYTESDQQNVMFNADSSTGKTYICNEVSKLFPPQDVKVYGKTTPTAFYYSQSLQEKDKETGQPYINLERRILIFTEQPDTQLQENLRALLSHDSKQVPFAITNKNKNGKNVAMEGYILGYPSTFFCSANMRIDEQEQTRCLILSPESTPEKIMAGIDVSIAKNSHKDAYSAKVESDRDRKQLMERILYIKNLHIGTIDIGDSEYLKTKFMEGRDILLPKAQREISHFISIVKAMALINAPFRLSNGKIVANNKDIDEAMKLWKPLSKSMTYGVSPQIFNFYKNVILAAYYAKDKETFQTKGVTFKEISAEYFSQTGSYPNMENVRKQYIPALQTASLISCEKDEDDKRQIIVKPLVFLDDDIEN